MNNEYFLSLVVSLKIAAKVRKKVHLCKHRSLFFKKNTIFCIFCQKNLRMSKKSSTFAAAFDREHQKLVGCPSG